MPEFSSQPNTKPDTSALKHIAFIMDGNGRWAKTKGMPREYGHTVGARVFSDITEYCGDIGIDTVTVYAFSTENWKRPKREVDAIMKLFGDYIKKAADTMMKRNIRIIFLGSKAPFSEKVQRDMEEIEEKSKNNARTLNIAINYGGRNELVHAVNEAIAAGEPVTEETIGAHLYTKNSPPPDLIVRTGGEMRLSNFLLWQAAYAELYFCDTLWPDFSSADVDRAILEFNGRKRRFGGV